VRASAPLPPPEAQVPLLASASLDESICLWDVQTGTRLHRFRPDRLYEGLVITGATVLAPGQRASLISLGAVEKT
jgi:WD40 repeat protein